MSGEENNHPRKCKSGGNHLQRKNGWGPIDSDCVDRRIHGAAPACLEKKYSQPASPRYLRDPHFCTQPSKTTVAPVLNMLRLLSSCYSLNNIVEQLAQGLHRVGVARLKGWCSVSGRKDTMPCKCEIMSQKGHWTPAQFATGRVLEQMPHWYQGRGIMSRQRQNVGTQLPMPKVLQTRAACCVMSLLQLLKLQTNSLN